MKDLCASPNRSGSNSQPSSSASESKTPASSLESSPHRLIWSTKTSELKARAAQRRPQPRAPSVKWTKLWDLKLHRSSRSHSVRRSPKWNRRSRLPLQRAVGTIPPRPWSTSMSTWTLEKKEFKKGTRSASWNQSNTTQSKYRKIMVSRSQLRRPRRSLVSPSLSSRPVTGMWLKQSRFIRTSIS